MPRNLPNIITITRLILALLIFVVLGLVEHLRGPALLTPDAASRESLLLNVCVVIFGMAAASDMLDGHIARRWGLQTDFGRIVDPFADKVIVCGTFIMLVPLEGSQVRAWMVVVILARELLVDGLRGFAESKGIAFPSRLSGKLKMTLQSLCLGWILLAMANLPGVMWAEWFGFALLYATVAITVVSGLSYVFHARSVLRADTLGSLRGDAGGSR